MSCETYDNLFKENDDMKVSMLLKFLLRPKPSDHPSICLTRYVIILVKRKRFVMKSVSGEIYFIPFFILNKI